MSEISEATQSVADRPRYDCRNAYVETLAELAHENHRIVGVVNDSVGSSKLDAFKKAFPDRLINVGIAEQDMVGVAAGLANGGRIAFVSAASCFLTGRALEQIKADVAYSNRNV
jgi:transketolase